MTTWVCQSQPTAPKLGSDAQIQALCLNQQAIVSPKLEPYSLYNSFSVLPIELGFLTRLPPFDKQQKVSLKVPDLNWMDLRASLCWCQPSPIVIPQYSFFLCVLLLCSTYHPPDLFEASIGFITILRLTPSLISIRIQGWGKGFSFVATKS